MRLVVLGGAGAWPAAGEACGGYLLEHEGFTLLLDPGYATVPRLLQRLPAERLDAVLVTHGHPDHCADLNPLLRARVLPGTGVPRLPVLAPSGAIDAVLALDWDGVDLVAGHRSRGRRSGRPRPLQRTGRGRHRRCRGGHRRLTGGAAGRTCVIWPRPASARWPSRFWSRIGRVWS